MATKLLTIPSSGNKEVALEVGVKVVYVGQIITQSLRDGWATLTF